MCTQCHAACTTRHSQHSGSHLALTRRATPIDGSSCRLKRRKPSPSTTPIGCCQPHPLRERQQVGPCIRACMHCCGSFAHPRTRETRSTTPPLPPVHAKPLALTAYYAQHAASRTTWKRVPQQEFTRGACEYGGQWQNNSDSFEQGGRASPSTHVSSSLRITGATCHVRASIVLFCVYTSCAVSVCAHRLLG